MKNFIFKEALSFYGKFFQLKNFTGSTLHTPLWTRFGNTCEKQYIWFQGNHWECMDKSIVIEDIQICSYKNALYLYGPLPTCAEEHCKHRK